MNNDDPIEKAQEVMKLIPHRYPFLLVDRILSYDTESLIAIKSVTINEPFFQGHFPDRPIMPGVLIVESMAQAASCLVVLENENKDSANLSVLCASVFFCGRISYKFTQYPFLDNCHAVSHPAKPAPTTFIL